MNSSNKQQNKSINTIWLYRSIVFVTAAALIVSGIINGSADDVLTKAVNICMECIGLG